MKKSIKSYLVFTSFLYRMVMYLLVPAILAGIALWASAVGDAALMLAAVLLPIVEIISDSWVFGGIHTKDPAKLDYLKTSGRGRGVMRSALILDMARRFLFAAGILGICKLAIWLARGAAGQFAEEGAYFWDVMFSGVPGMGGIKGLGVYLCLVTLSYFFAVLGTFLSRYGSLIWINMMISYIVGLLEIVSFCLPGLMQYTFGYALLFGVLGVLVSVLTVRTAMKKMEESYYDK